jgi:ferredoxin
MRIAVIGSGMSAVSSLEVLKSTDEVQVVNFRLNDQIDLTSESGVYFKKNFGDGHTYDISKYSKFHSSDRISSSLVASKGLNGFSDVWGASLDSEDNGYISSAGEFFFEVKSPPIELDEIVKSRGGSLRIHTENAILARSLNLCKNIGQCLTGCPNNAIWRSSYYYEKQRKNLNIETIDQGIERLAFIDNQIQLTTFSGEKYFADKVLVAAGTLGTLALLNRSFEQFNEFEFKDSATQFFVALKLRRTKLKKNSALHQWRIAFDSESYSAQMQIYPDISDLFETAKFGRNSLEVVLLKIFWPFAQKLCIAGILYIDGQNSHSIKLKFQNGTGILSSKVNEKQDTVRSNIWRATFRKSIKLGFFPIKKSFQDNGSGSGFHFGQTSVRYNNVYYPLNDFIAQNFPSKSLLIVDSNSLKIVPAGPITSLIKRNAKLITEQFITTSS